MHPMTEVLTTNDVIRGNIVKKEPNTNNIMIKNEKFNDLRSHVGIHNNNNNNFSKFMVIPLNNNNQPITRHAQLVELDEIKTKKHNNNNNVDILPPIMPTTLQNNHNIPYKHEYNHYNNVPYFMTNNRIESKAFSLNQKGIQSEQNDIMHLPRMNNMLPLNSVKIPMNTKIETEMKHQCTNFPSLNLNDDNNKIKHANSKPNDDLKKLIKNNNRDKIVKKRSKKIKLTLNNSMNNTLLSNKISKMQRKKRALLDKEEYLPQDNGKFPLAYSSHLPTVGFPYYVQINLNYNNNNKKTKNNITSRKNKNKSKCLWICKYELKNDMYCNKSFMQKCHWMRHCLEKHTSKRFECRFCQMKYAQNSSLKEHIAIYHSDTPPKFICPYCKITNNNITFTRWTSVLRHVRKQHPNMKEPNKKDQKQISIDKIVTQLFKKME